MDIFKIIFWILLLDSLFAIFIAFSKYRDYFNNFYFFKRFMPLAKGWAIWYLILALFIGYIIYFN